MKAKTGTDWVTQSVPVLAFNVQRLHIEYNEEGEPYGFKPLWLCFNNAQQLKQSCLMRE